MLWDNDFVQLYGELIEAVDEIRPYYDIDKIKWYSVYIWTKDNPDDSENPFGDNVFDIQEDGITLYVKDHVIIEEAKPIIKKIQTKLKELSQYRDGRAYLR